MHFMGKYANEKCTQVPNDVIMNKKHRYADYYEYRSIFTTTPHHWHEDTCHDKGNISMSRFLHD